MGGGARGPRLPKRSVIEKLTQKGPECLPEMLGVLSCFKETGFNEAKCAAQMRALSECTAQQVCFFRRLYVYCVFAWVRRCRQLLATVLPVSIVV